jgi:hypothetical protein
VPQNHTHTTAAAVAQLKIVHDFYQHIANASSFHFTSVPYSLLANHQQLQVPLQNNNKKHRKRKKRIYC